MLLPKQIWKDISGYEGKYQVSNTGKVRSLNYKRTRKSKVLKICTNKKDGYKRVMLFKNGKYKAYLVHRLVAQAFIPNPNNYPIINHKDENRSNNYYKNLEWCTYEYNNNYGGKNERISKSRKGKCAGVNNYQTRPILMFTLDGEFIKRFNCTTEANEFLGKDKYNKSINNCLRGKSKTAWEYIWKYE